MQKICHKHEYWCKLSNEFENPYMLACRTGYEAAVLIRIMFKLKLPCVRLWRRFCLAAAFCGYRMDAINFQFARQPYRKQLGMRTFSRFKQKFDGTDGFLMPLHQTMTDNTTVTLSFPPACLAS